MTVLLTDNLPLLAGAPNGIKKLRELILELAVRGKLVSQDSGDEPASELLKRIADEKARLVAEGKIKKQKQLAEIAPEEKVFDVPANWAWVRVAAVGHDWGQKTPDQEFTYIDVGSVDNALGVISAPQVVTADDAPSRARKVVRPGTVIYSTIRPYLLNVAVIDEVYAQEPIASTAFAIIHPYVGMPSRYFLWYLRSPVFVRYVESVQMGIAYPAINDGKFFSGLIPLPPLAEQHRIVAKVDELMALCDRLEARQVGAESAHAQLVQALLDSLTQASDAADFSASWQRLAEHFHTLFTTEPSIDALKQTLLQLAVMGKLVPQDVSDEPAKVWLEKGLVRTSKIRRGIPEDVAMDQWVDTFPVLESWAKLSTAQLLRANAVIDVKDGNHGANHPVKGDWTEDGLPFITAAQVNGFNIDYEGANKISGEPLQRLRVGFSEPGDVIYTHKGSVGRTAINSRSCVLSPQTTYYRPNGEVIFNRYLMYFFQSVFFTRQVDKVKNQTTRDFVPITQQYLFFILVPPVKEQHRIVAKVDQLMALCDQLKSRLTQARQLNEQLACALVEQAVA
ncbi:restriction endonuclease subunit S [Pseudomonas sp. BN411]|uniref:restriction endonuclease subunit S n=1 Tax=Pseudomonas sp. BN411 TaxID=2567887 RepID=UPI0024571E42|nr:restriction endonuclease subunit S [Pseudomonas sp. BN411]MDH4562314.1 restriction endonuclease subunit S [Pseudomonas sp. BN411]